MKSWNFELYKALLVCSVAFLIGLMFGKQTLFLIISLLLILLWHGYQFRKFIRWVEEGSWLIPPNVGGIWGELYGSYYRLKKRHKKRKKRLLTMLQQLQETASALPDATLELGERGEIIRWNSAAHRLLGLSRSQDVGLRIDNLIRIPVFSDYLSKGNYKESVVFSSPIDAKIILSVQVIPYGDNRRLMVARDITRLHNLEKIRQDFVGNVSHELKTPLTVVRGFIETIQENDDECGKKWQRSLDLMKEQTVRMQHIVEDLIFLSRLETKPMNNVTPTVKVGALIETLKDEAYALIAAVPEKELSISIDVDNTLNLLGEQSELRSAFSNLITNAVYYSKPKGHVRISWKRQGSSALFTVRDDGIGIPLEEIPRITERFYRVEKSRNRQTGGTGLGLAIVKHVLTRHQAELNITSQINVGSTFVCRFPEARIASE